MASTPAALVHNIVGNVGGEKNINKKVEAPGPVEQVNTIPDDDCWFLRGKVEGLNMEWLMDCGANPNLLSIKVYDQIPEATRPKLQPVRTKLIAANGENIVIYGQVAVDLQLEGAMFSVPVIVADIGKTLGILGMRFLRDTDCSIAFRQGLLRCGQQEWNLVGSSGAVGFKVQLIREVRIPPGHGIFVDSVVDVRDSKSSWDGILEPEKSFSAQTQITVPRSLVKVPQGIGPITRISLTNWTDEEVILMAGTTLGSVEPAHDIERKEKVQVASAHNALDHKMSRELPEHLKELAERAGKNLNVAEKDKVNELLARSVTAFANPDGTLGTTELVTHTIDTGNARPFRIPYRPPGFAKKEIIEENLEKMLINDVIEPSNSPWSSPVVLVKKKDGSTRFCVDLRHLNDITRKDVYPLPNINDCLGSLSGAQWFSTLDLASGYWQVSMDKADKEKTAFSTHRGLYQFKKMPFGLTNAPATFMRLMELVLKGLEWEQCLVYLDDIIVFGRTFAECMERLENIFRRIMDAGLKLKPSKCELFETEVAFLGHRVGRNGIGCDPAKIANVRNWPIPESISDVRSFLGLANYYKRFVKDFSNVALPLTTLTNKGHKFEWNESCAHSFLTLKNALTAAPLLAYPSPDPQDVFILDTDASNFGIGAVLSQMQEGEEKVIAYASKGLSRSQRNYCTTYRELLALVEFAPYFKHYLLGRRFVVRTDHSSLRWLHRFKDAEGLVGRWLAKLANYDYEIKHRAGIDHGNADAMSRNPLITLRRRCGREECQECLGTTSTPVKCTVSIVGSRRLKAYSVGYTTAVRMEAEPEGLTSDEEEETEIGPVAIMAINPKGYESNWVASWSVDELKQFQREDISIRTIIGWLEKDTGKPSRSAISKHGPEVKDLCGLWSTLIIKDGLLYRKWEKNEQGTVIQLITPAALRSEIFKQLHSSRAGGHLGVKRTQIMIRARFFWPGAKSDVVRWCKNCNECARVKSGPRPRAALQQEPVGQRFERVAIDIMGELPETINGNKYILVLSDYFTKWTQAFALKDQTAFTVAEALMTNCFNFFGMPRWIHSDQGRNFESELFSELCGLLEIHKTRTTPYHPQSDGMVERFNRTCQQMLKCFINENRDDWDDHLPYIMLAYRSSPHESTGMSPNLMMFGEELARPIDLMVGAPPRHDSRYKCRTEYVEWLRQTITRAHIFAREQLGIAAKHQKEYYDRKADPVSYPAGSFVWWWYPPNANRKLGIGWSGPYKVVERPTDIHCIIQLAPTAKKKRVHINQVKPHLGRVPVEWKDFIPPPEGNPEETRESDTEEEQELYHPDISDLLADTQINEDPQGEIPTLVETNPIGSPAAESLPVLRRSDRATKPLIRLNL